MVIIEDSTDNSISIQKLYEESDYDAILDQNLKDLPYWQTVYPSHESWIRNVIDELKNDTYTRIAFGGFFHNKRTGKEELCCSAMVKKNPFSSYLEIKNFIVFKYNEGNPELLARKYQHQLIAHIKKYAEQRGYTKLAIELLNRNKNDKELIKRFFESDFVFAGRQTDKYKDSDEIVFLTCSINPIYGYDPYDNISAGLWVISTFLKAENIRQDKSIEILTNKDKWIIGSAFSFFSNRKFDEPVKEKFNTKYKVLIIEEYFNQDHPCEYLKEIKTADAENTRIFILDFTTENITGPLKNKESFTIFNRTEIELLMFNHDGAPVQKKLPYETIGGLLLISNPERVDEARIRKILKEKKTPIYIKLGSQGRYITDDMTLVFAYYSKKQRNTIEIWATAGLQGPANFMDLRQLRVDYGDSPPQKGKKIVRLKSDGERLFYYIDEIQDDNIEVPVWTREEFDKHNSYNETDQVVCFNLEDFSVVSENRRIKLESVLESPASISDPENVFDFYLSKKEVDLIKNKISRITDKKNKGQSKRNHAKDIKSGKQSPVIKLLYLGAHPVDQTDIHNEFDKIESIVEHTKDIRMLSPCWSTNNEKLNYKLKRTEPHVLYIAAHGDKSGIYLQNNITLKKELLENKELDNVFAGRNAHLKLIILSACSSNIQAEKISKMGYYVIGYTGEFENPTVFNFAEKFFAGFSSATATSTMAKRIKAGCINFFKAHPEETRKVKIWKDGDVMDYLKL